MAEEQGFTQARARLEEIVVQVRKKDTSLEQSLDLLEEGVRLANQCTELVDHSEWKPSAESVAEAEPVEVAQSTQAPAEAAEAADMVAPHDKSATDVVPVADSVSGGTDAASYTEAASESASDFGADEDYDDIFADED